MSGFNPVPIAGTGAQGSPNPNIVFGIQGLPAGTPVPVSGSFSITSTNAVNITEFGSISVMLGATSSAFSIPVVLATDQQTLNVTYVDLATNNTFNSPGILLIHPNFNGDTVFQVSGTWTGNINFEVSTDGTDFKPVYAYPVPSGPGVTSTSSNGLWVVPSAGFYIVQANLTNISAGSVNIYGRVSGTQLVQAVQPTAGNLNATVVSPDLTAINANTAGITSILTGIQADLDQFKFSSGNLKVVIEDATIDIGNVGLLNADNTTQINPAREDGNLLSAKNDLDSIKASVLGLTSIVATQTTLAQVKSDLDTISSLTTGVSSTLAEIAVDTNHLDVNLSTLATQATLAQVKSDLDTISTNTIGISSTISEIALDTDHLDVNLSTLATATVQSQIKSDLDTISSLTTGVSSTLAEIVIDTDHLDVNLSTLATATVQSQIKTDLDTINTNTIGISSTIADIAMDTEHLDVNLSTVATQATLAQVKTDLDTINTNIAGISSTIPILKVGEHDYVFNFDGIISTFGEIKTAQPQQILGGTFEVSPLETATWLSPSTNGATSSTVNGELVLQTNTTANGSIVVNTRYNSAFSSGHPNIFYSGVRLGDTGTTNNTRRWGVFDTNNGMFFQLSGTTISVVIRKAGSDTVITSFSNASPVIDTNYHLYEIYYTQGSFFFLQDKILIHKQSSTNTVLTTTLSLPVRFENTNSGGSTTNVSMYVRSGTIVRFGNLTENSLRVYVSLNAEAIASVAVEALVTLNINRNGVVTSGTSYTVPPGKTFRLEEALITVTVASGSVITIYRLRADTAALTASSPIIAAGRTNAVGSGPTAGGAFINLPVGRGIDFPAGTNIGVSHSGATGAIEDFSIIGFEY